MKFTVLTLFPELVAANLSQSILKRAIEAGVIEVEIINPRDFTKDKHKKVDDTPYGGGAGMLLAVQPFYDAFLSVDKTLNPRTFITTPSGKKYDQNFANELSRENHIILLCGHYEGFDQRIIDLIKPEEISIGDYVLTGGELPALCIIDSVTRLLDGAIGNNESAEFDSFQHGLLEHPHYTKPREYEGLKVPEVLLNGNHKEIEEWRFLKQLEITKQKRPDLFEKFVSEKINSLPKNLKKFFKNFYI
ncbi:tRNA (guanosine(37)-N1)-methyltransferase TrmD [bacterium]|nr:tRNA (guanosine(37)-N1)-methyltransferase TrmD [bacterium]